MAKYHATPVPRGWVILRNLRLDGGTVFPTLEAAQEEINIRAADDWDKARSAANVDRTPGGDYEPD